MVDIFSLALTHALLALAAWRLLLRDDLDRDPVPAPPPAPAPAPALGLPAEPATPPAGTDPRPVRRLIAEPRDHA
ncbi:hypothetical protein ACFOON_03960 [Novosphingobium piscinae]|uniref:Uncharacterized protein n=1 Tax=Novosphingobium piscinae TaxID=1507448 RepID=A0A7X1G0G9_9SPHN|nr:hypothetical protein [Novosphingobium piscinae]MBC2670239.1 hypothetical protein [Novosphingobium piscinae]